MKKGQDLRTQRTFTRKLHLVPGDESIHEPLAIAEQAEYFGRSNQVSVGRWASGYAMFVAFDRIASYAAPSSVKDLPPPGPYASVPLSSKLVDVSIVNICDTKLV